MPPASQDSSSPVLRTWAAIDLGNFRHNLDQSLTGSADTMAVVKADAYGHGLLPIAEAAIAAGMAYIGVANCHEARNLHAGGINHPIYILGPTFPEERREIVEHGWTPCLSSTTCADEFDALAEALGVAKIKVHLAVDTGMGRGGVLPCEAIALAQYVSTKPRLTLEGVGSHLPSADEDEAFTRAQISAFAALAAEMRSALPEITYYHISNSAGLLDYEQLGLNLVRPGLMLYGCSPIAAHQKRLRPVMSLRSRISIIRSLPAGHGISYGRSTILARETRVATIGVGYGDGYPRSLSESGTDVWIAGHRCPLLGRVTMDQIMVDVTDHPHAADLAAGDEVELFGENIPVAEIAQKAGTIPWEIFTGIMPRVQRVYTDSQPWRISS